MAVWGRRGTNDPLGLFFSPGVAGKGKGESYESLRERLFICFVLFNLDNIDLAALWKGVALSLCSYAPGDKDEAFSFSPQSRLKLPPPSTTLSSCFICGKKVVKQKKVDSQMGQGQWDHGARAHVKGTLRPPFPSGLAVWVNGEVSKDTLRPDLPPGLAGVWQGENPVWIFKGAFFLSGDFCFNSLILDKHWSCCAVKRFCAETLYIYIHTHTLLTYIYILFQTLVS